VDEDDEIVQEFLVESHENLDQLDRDLVELEKSPGSRELLSSVFRTIHTIKGTSGFLAFGRLESLTHVGENLLSRLREGELTMTPAIAGALLNMVDGVRALLAAIEQTGADVDESVDVDSMVALIKTCLDGDAAGPAPEAPAEPAPQPVAETAPEPAVGIVPEPVAEPAAEAVPVLEERRSGADRRVDGEDRRDPDAPERRGVADSTVRVDVDLLDTLVRLVGELVLTRNQILQQADVTAHVDLVRASQRLNLVASELQETVMRTRMQPIGQVWAKIPRLVRDLGAQLGRTVKLEMEGQDTELDRSLLEAVRDPLTHLVRNSVDHGIEDAAVRLANGKPAEGTLSLRAYHESGQVVVEITDDGRGLDADRIGQVAVQRGVASPEALARMSPRDVFDLIFRPGFSTASAVTNVSGRGVGMDVVRTNIERIGGTVDLTSQAGQGTTVRVRIPLTLAIIPALIVGEGGERYAIPQANLVELVRLEPADLARDVEVLAGAPVLRLRGHLLPLVPLAGALGLDEEPRDAITVVVVQADDVRFGLSVEEVHDTQEIVVKPLGRQLKSIAMYAGATIMGDGRVALILDVAGIAHANGVTATPVRVEADTRTADSDLRSLLVLDVGGGRRAALPLGEVSRLEEFASDLIERTGPTEVVQYRDGILPLVHLASAIGLPVSDVVPELLSVIVHGDGPDRVGIVVDRVVDVVETAIVANRVGIRAGVLGSAVVQDRVTDLVDLDAVVATAGRRIGVGA
jgi:two-component system chemotaxis sensor kinase CheA